MKPKADVLQIEKSVAAFRKSADISSAESMRIADAANRQAAVLANKAQLDLVSQLTASSKASLVAKESFSDFRNKMLEQFNAAAGDARLGKVFRESLQRAYAKSRTESLTNSKNISRRPFWRFSSVMDGATTLVCKECNGTVLPAAHPWWKSHTPPLHFHCRSTVLPLGVSEAKSLGVAQRPPRAVPSDGFGDLSDEYRPKLSSYPAQLRRLYEAKVKRMLRGL